MLLRAAIVVVLASLSATPTLAAPPTLDEKVQALGILVRLQAAEPPDSIAAKLYGQAIATAVMAMAGINPQGAPDAEGQKRFEALQRDSHPLSVGPRREFRRAQGAAEGHPLWLHRARNDGIGERTERDGARWL
ncbi:MAG: hypothetical protein Q8O67_32010 [Deltaproteobacteria bacterium]|nr:hypothetical protein [Deltaproteobacteria bacterium]